MAYANSNISHLERMRRNQAVSSANCAPDTARALLYAAGMRFMDEQPTMQERLQLGGVFLDILFDGIDSVEAEARQSGEDLQIGMGHQILIASQEMRARYRDPRAVRTNIPEKDPTAMATSKAALDAARDIRGHVGDVYYEMQQAAVQNDLGQQ